MKKKRDEKDEIITSDDAYEVAKLAGVRLRQVAGDDNQQRAQCLINCLESAYAYYFLKNRKQVKVREMPPNFLYATLNYLNKEFWRVFMFEPIKREDVAEINE